MHFLLALVLAAIAFATPAQAARPGQAAPPFALPDKTGSEVSFAALRGRVVYVDFWASWCGPCRRSFPWMNAMQARYGNDGLAIVGINVDKRRDDAERFLRDIPASFTIAYDPRGSTPAIYDVKGMPTSFLIDRRGVVVEVEEGFRDERSSDVEARIRALLAQH
jgi:cytochrome c biogenesis protein CcmG/thiol:disulfide interchange protein DsbE